MGLEALALPQEAEGKVVKIRKNQVKEKEVLFGLLFLILLLVIISSSTFPSSLWSFFGGTVYVGRRHIAASPRHPSRWILGQNGVVDSLDLGMWRIWFSRGFPFLLQKNNQSNLSPLEKDSKKKNILWSSQRNIFDTHGSRNLQAANSKNKQE